MTVEHEKTLANIQTWYKICTNLKVVVNIICLINGIFEREPLERSFRNMTYYLNPYGSTEQCSFYIRNILIRITCEDNDYMTITPFADSVLCADFVMRMGYDEKALNNLPYILDRLTLLLSCQ